MKGSEILTQAALVIKQYGWSQGSHARDTEGRPCRITSAEAAYFSIYGAITKVMARNDLIAPGGDDKAVQGYQPMWDILTTRARRDRRAYSHVHPVIDFNDDSGRSQDAAIELLLDAADLLKDLELASEQAETTQKEPK